MKRLTITILLVSLFLPLAAQEKAILPLDLPVSFSGTYGELRRDHFHGGYDFRVGGKVGDPIHAIKSGYISRIGVSVGGYGNSVYITHEDGTISVYGHLLSFSDPIAKYVKRAQYEKESFAVQLYPAEGEFVVKQGDVIGKVGSTGASAGPHLHLELRDAATNNTINYIAKGVYNHPDKIPPVFRRIYLYAYCDTLQIPFSYRFKSLKTVQSDAEVLLPHKSYLAIDAIDKQEGTPARLAVEEYKVSLDGKEIYCFKVGDVSYAQDPYIKSVIAYEESYKGGADLVKTLVEKGNLLSSKITYENEGLIVLEDYKQHTLKVEVSDISGNRSVLKYKVRRNDFAANDREHYPDTTQTVKMLWYTPNVVRDEAVSFSLAAGSLYSSIYFPFAKIAEADAAGGLFSALYQIGERSCALHKRGVLKIKCDLPERLREKAVMASFSGGKLYYAGGRWKEDGVVARVSFGNYCVAVDTLAPVVNFIETKGNIVRGAGEVVLSVKDDFSGIASAVVEVDGKWAISYIKRGRIRVQLDRDRIPKGKHTIRVTVKDNCGNEAVTERKFTW